MSFQSKLINRGYLQIFFVLVALTLGLLLRLYKLDSPVADWHSHRQADTASVTKIFIQSGINFFVPKYHDLSNVQSGFENPQGYRMVEAPIYNTLATFFHQIFKTNIEVSSRLVSIIFSLASAILIFLICIQQTKLFLPSYFSMLVFLFLPFNIYYSRTILPEPTTVFFMLATLYFFKKNIILSGIFFSITLLLKPFPGIVIFPTLLLFTFQQYLQSFNKKNIFLLFLFSIISLTPFFLWRQWINHFPQGIPKNDWLLNNGVTTTFPLWYHGYNLSFLNKLIAFRPHWWQWLFEVRIPQLILGTYGIISLILGLAYKKNRSQTFSWSLIVGIFIYFVIVAQGNIQHDYYQVIIIPSISIICGFGYYYISQFLFTKKIVGYLLTGILFFFSIYFSYIKIKEYYQINNDRIILAGKKAQEILPKNSLVIAPYSGDTAFLYQTGFKGWPIEIYDIDKIIKDFPDNQIYLISINYDQYTNKLIPKYKTVISNNEYIILKLTP